MQYWFPGRGVSWYTVEADLINISFIDHAHKIGMKGGSTVWEKYLVSFYWVAATFTCNGLECFVYFAWLIPFLSVPVHWVQAYWRCNTSKCSRNDVLHDLDDTKSYSLPIRYRRGFNYCYEIRRRGRRISVKARGCRDFASGFKDRQGSSRWNPTAFSSCPV